MAIAVVMCACFIIADVGPSELTTALRASVWHRNKKMPDMMYSKKSPRNVASRRLSTENIT